MGHEAQYTCGHDGLLLLINCFINYTGETPVSHPPARRRCHTNSFSRLGMIAINDGSFELLADLLCLHMLARDFFAGGLFELGEKVGIQLEQSPFIEDQPVRFLPANFSE